MLYDTWKKTLDEQCQAELGIDADDLIDTDFYVLYEQGFTPAEAFMECQIMSRAQFPEFCETQAA